MAQIVINTDEFTAQTIKVIANREGNLLDAISKAMMIDKLKTELEKGIAHFTYRKVSGEVREAWGTTLKALCSKHLSGNGNRRANYGTLSYFDVEKGDFRCFCIENIISVE